MAEALILLAAIIVDLACRVIPAQLPYLFPFVFNAPVFFACWLTLLWYLRGLSRTARPDWPGPVRRGFFLAGLAGIYFVLQTHFEYMAQHMFFLNRVQAVMLGMVAPFGIAIGWMPDVLRRGAPAWLILRVALPLVTPVPQLFEHVAGHQEHRFAGGSSPLQSGSQKNVADFHNAMRRVHAHVAGVAGALHGRFRDDGQKNRRRSRLLFGQSL